MLPKQFLKKFDGVLRFFGLSSRHEVLLAPMRPWVKPNAAQRLIESYYGGAFFARGRLRPRRYAFRVTPC